MSILLVSLAFAAPDRVAATLGEGTVHDVTVSSTGSIVAWTDGTGGVGVYDADGWVGEESTADCTATAGVAVAATSDGYTVLVGCDDGRVFYWTADVYGRLTSESTELVTHAGAVLALETDDTNVYVVATSDTDGGTEVDAYDLATGEQVADFPTTLAYDTVNDSILVEDYLYVVHDSSKVSKVYLIDVAPSVPSDTITADFVDGWAYSSGTVYLADDGGSVILYQPSANELSISLDDIATSVTGVAAGEDYMLIGTDTEVLQYAFSEGTPAGEEAVIADAGGIGDMVVAGNYVIGATSAGVAVLTEVPWISDVTLSQSLAAAGYEVEFSFLSDMDGTWRLSRGTDAELRTGSVVSGEPVTTTFTVDGDFVEGTNRLYITVDSLGLEGVAAADLEVNNPPAVIDLREDEVLPGDEQIHILTGTLSEEDLAFVDVYLSTQAFSAGDYPETGGPDYVGPDGKANPVAKTVTPGITDEVIVSGLTNGTTYYVAVRPRDSSGLEGPMSDVFSVTPDETYTLAEMKGDDSGFCGVAAARAGWLSVFAGLLLARRRQFAGAAMFVALLVPGAAEARDSERPHWDVEVRYGPFISQAEPYITDSFGATGNTLFRMEYGWRSQFLEADFGLGLYRDTGYLFMADGTLSGDATIFTNVPLDLSVTGRLHFWEGQPVIPYARIGGTYSLWVQDWHENPLDSEYQSRAGGKFGWHWGGGVMFLLDWLDEKAASELQVSAGIDDTYLVAEYRAAYLMHADDEIDLSESDLTIGLKFDF